MFERWRREAPGGGRRGDPPLGFADCLGVHLGVDVAEDALFWARSCAGPHGMRLLEWGEIAIGGNHSLAEVLRRLRRSRGFRLLKLEVPLRSPELQHRRLELPPLRPADAYKIGQRRAADFAREQNGEFVSSFMRLRQAGAHPMWLVAAPRTGTELFEARWRDLGCEVYRMSSEPLALGNLTRLLEPTGGELTAIFDIHEQGGDCVVCDEKGWLFNRIIQMRGAPTDGSAGEVSEAHRARIATQLERTFSYVARDLSLGQVGRVALAGHFPDWDGLRQTLETQLQIPCRPIADFVLDGPARDLDPRAARAVGIAMAPDPRGCSLLPSVSQDRHRFARARLRLRLALSAAVCLSTLAFGSWLLGVASSLDAIAALEAKLEQVGTARRDVARVATMRARAAELEDTIARLRRPEPPWSTALHVFGAVMPPEVALDEVEIRRAEDGWETNAIVEARGVAVSDAAQAIGEFSRQVRSVPFFALRAVTREQSRQAEDGARVFFRMVGRMAEVTSDARAPEATGE